MNDQQQSRADALTDEHIATLKLAARAVTPQDIDGAERIESRPDGSYITCPACEGEGCIPFESDYCNYDHVAIGVQFYGVGTEPGAAEAYFRAAKPATILALLDRLERAESALAAPPVEQPAAATSNEQRSAINEAARVLEQNWEHATADSLREAFSIEAKAEPQPEQHADWRADFERQISAVGFDISREEFGDEYRHPDSANAFRWYYTGRLDEACSGVRSSRPAAAPIVSAPADERADAICDSAYCAGLQQGFSFGQMDDNEGLRKALEARAGYVKVLREARAAASPAAERVTAALQALSADVHTLGDGWANDEAMIGLAKKYLRVEPKPASPELSLWRDFVLLAVTDAAPQPAQADAPAHAAECPHCDGEGVIEGDSGTSPCACQRDAQEGMPTFGARRAQADAPAEARERDDPELIAASNKGYAAGLRDGKALGACGPLAPADAGEAAAWRYRTSGDNWCYCDGDPVHVCDRDYEKQPLYTAPPAARVASLTNSQREAIEFAAKTMEARMLNAHACVLRALLNGADKS